MRKKRCGGRLCYFLTGCLASVALACMAWSSCAFCDEIHDAAEAGDLQRVKTLLEGNPALVFSKDKDGATPLHKAAEVGRIEVVKLLLANKADVNARDKDGNTPLHEAMFVQVLSAFEDIGARIGASLLPIKDDKPKPSSFSGSAERQKEVVNLLLANKADVNARNNGGATPLHLAVSFGHKDMVSLLLANKADVNARGDDGSTPLHIAAVLPEKDVAEILLAGNAEVNAKDNDGKTPLQNAVTKGQKETADLLRQHGGKTKVIAKPTRDPIRVGGNVQESKLLVKVEPVYPELAKRARVSGVVILQVTINEAGEVYEARILRGHPLLDEAAVNAVRQWRYSTTLLNGVPVPVVATVTVIFNAEEQ